VRDSGDVRAPGLSVEDSRARCRHADEAVRRRAQRWRVLQLVDERGVLTVAKTTPGAARCARSSEGSRLNVIRRPALAQLDERTDFATSPFLQVHPRAISPVRPGGCPASCSAASSRHEVDTVMSGRRTIRPAPADRTLFESETSSHLTRCRDEMVATSSRRLPDPRSPERACSSRGAGGSAGLDDLVRPGHPKETAESCSSACA